MAEQVVLLLLACAVLFAAAFMGFLTALQYRNMVADKDYELAEARRNYEQFIAKHVPFEDRV